MLTASDIKRSLSMQVVAERYGFTPNRSGNIHCPFHDDKNESLKVYEKPGRGFFCYACNAGGSVIDFAMKLFGLSYKDAVRKIGSDFGLSADSTDPAVFKKMKRIENKKQKERTRLLQQIETLSKEHCQLWEVVRDSEPLSDAWSAAMHRITTIEINLEVLECQTVK